MIHSKQSIQDAVYDYDADGEHRGKIYNWTFRSPLCINTFRFDLYRDWQIDKILVFESFIVYTFKYGNNFYRPYKRLTKDLRLTEYSIRKQINNLVEEGYIQKRLLPEDENFKNEYFVDYNKILTDLDKIYRFEVLDPDDSEMLRYYYDKMFEAYYNRSFDRDSHSASSHGIFKPSI